MSRDRRRLLLAIVLGVAGVAGLVVHCRTHAKWETGFQERITERMRIGSGATAASKGDLLPLTTLDARIVDARVVTFPYGPPALSLARELDPCFYKWGTQTLGEREWLLEVDYGDREAYELLGHGPGYSIETEQQRRAATIAGVRIRGSRVVLVLVEP